MTKCVKCERKSIISGYCNEHFPDYFEDTVKNTIKRFSLLKKSDKVVVAVSGGKDSLATLFILKKLGYNVSGLAVDEGIKGYRQTTLDDLERFAKEHEIKINIISFKDEFGVSLDDAIKKLDLNPCYVCGVLRRYVLNKHSHGYDVIATGHNLDDEAQAFLMNIFKSQPELLARLGPVTGQKVSSLFTRRIKPLYLLKDREVKAYTVLRGIRVNFTECPYSSESFRGSIQEELNMYESRHPGTKLNLINNFLDNLDYIKDKFATESHANKCAQCGQPSSKEVCRTCEIVTRLKE